MPALQDWAELARSTIRSLTRADVTGFYSREWLQVRRELVSQHRQEIDSERRRWKRWIRSANAIVFGLIRRLAPVRRIVFAAALLIALNGVLQLVPLRSSRSWGLKGPDAVVELTVAFLLVEFLLAMELIDKLAYRDELVLARDLQAALVTGSLPEHPNFELGAFNRPTPSGFAPPSSGSRSRGTSPSERHSFSIPTGSTRPATRAGTRSAKNGLSHSSISSAEPRLKSSCGSSPSTSSPSALAGCLKTMCRSRR